MAAPLGAGGMGEVYRARDSRLDRTVAIKVLPERLSSDARLRERFEREAKAISALTHPHICTLYDIGSHEGVDYLVMEFLEGESLADRLAKGALPLEQVIRYGVEIAEALERAHRAGIVHRDLKPGNIMLTKSGAKLLDFGLAKFAQPAVNDPNAATAAMTHAKPLTAEGAIVGTFQYMAPEQLEGRDADARTDIFAFGSVLYEMATGKRAFDAASRASLIASILDRDPTPISTIQPLTPTSLERVIQVCLAKDPDERWQSAHDVAAQLRWIRDASSERIAPVARTRRALARNAALLAGGLALGALLAWLALRDRAVPRRVSRVSIAAAPGAPVMLRQSAVAISRDGRRIVYNGITGTTSRLYVRDLDRAAPVPIAGSDGAYGASLSPDGKWVAFFFNGAIHKVAVEGGTPMKLTERIGGGLGLCWFGDTIYATRGFARGIWAVPADGSAARQVVKTNPANGERAVTWPDVLPDGKTVIATVWTAGSWDNARIVAYSTADGAKKKVLVEGGSFARYAPGGYLLFVRGGNLMAVTLDPKTLEVGANPVVVMSAIAHGTGDGEAQYAISQNGDLAVVHGGESNPRHRLVTFDAAGKKSRLTPAERRYGSVRIAPDGRTAAVGIEEAMYDVWELDVERDSATRVSYGGDDTDPIWNADGSRIIWVSSRNGVLNLYMRAADLSSPEERLTRTDADQEPLAVSPDGRYLLFAQERDLWLLPFDTRVPRRLMQTEFEEQNASISPDGKWLAYSSNASGRTEVYVTTFPQPGANWQVSTEGGANPQWLPNGREIVYANGNGYYVAPIETSPRVRAGKPRLLFEGLFDTDYSVAADGRIAIVELTPRTTVAGIDLVLNWSDELARRVPAP
ncbi:MAG TPA: protein kinase [Thermoanaerobaculia bacterium]